MSKTHLCPYCAHVNAVQWAATAPCGGCEMPLRYPPDPRSAEWRDFCDRNRRELIREVVAAILPGDGAEHAW